MNEFGQKLKELRNAKGLSQVALARRVGFSASLIGHYETGRQLPRLEVAARLDEHLGSGTTLADLRKQLFVGSTTASPTESPAANVAPLVESDLLASPKVQAALDTLRHALVVEAIAKARATAETPTSPADRSGSDAAARSLS